MVKKDRSHHHGANLTKMLNYELAEEHSQAPSDRNSPNKMRD